MCDGYSGIIRCVPLVDTSESSLTSYRYTDMRLTAAGDMWLKDNNYWFNSGYSTVTLVKGMCLTIATDGNITIPYLLKTPEIMLDIIRALTAQQITIDDNVTIIGNIVVNGVFKYSSSNVVYTAPFDNNLGQSYLNGANGNYIGFNKHGL